ncbi:MAG TPA: hemolysin, partial [Rhodospirillaceae bacterium]|nr:hemolysin [Rhodospirillaceae bacterium]
LSVSIKGVADAPTLDVKDVWVKEDAAGAQLKIDAKLTDPSETLTVKIENIDPSWTITNLAGGTYDAATKTWSITLAPGANFSGGPTFKAPANSDLDMTGLKVTATSTDGTDTASVTKDANIFVDAVADAPNLTTSNAGGDEGAAIALNIATSVNDNDGSEKIDSVVISGVPANYSLSAGTKQADGTWKLTSDQLNGLKLITTPGGSLNFTLTVTSTAKEQVAAGNPANAENDFTDNTATATKTIKVTLDPLADTPNLKVTDVWTKEDSSGVALKIETSPNSATETLTIKVTGIDTAAGWTITNLNGGTYDAATKTWSITLAPGASFNGGPTLKPPADSDADLTGIGVNVTATQTNGSTASANATTNVYVDAVADAPNLSASAGTGNEGTAIALNIATSVKDNDGSEKIDSVIIKGVPSGYTLSAGTKLANGDWSLTSDQLNGLKINTVKGGSLDFTLTVVST